MAPEPKARAGGVKPLVAAIGKAVEIGEAPPEKAAPRRPPMPAPRNELKAALGRGEVRFGLWMAFAHPTAAEIAARAGYDWCLIDGEHGPNDLPLILSQVQAMAGGGAEMCVRVPVGDLRILKQVLDIGLQNILVPMVDTPEDAAAMVRAVRYPGAGLRGVGAAQSRATGYGAIPDYVANAGDEICLMVQLESRTALDNVDAIAATEGVDVVFVGPADLAASLGHLGNPGHPEVQEAIAHAAARIRASGKALGMITFDTAGIAPAAEAGATFIAVGGDVAIYAAGVRTRAKEAARILGR
ncbi:2-keto-3-deoxy-L-rhamnonate aldolase [Rhodobacteraceae bacterium CCMM004]|nr:2-keto-3-deoxy-L-rhamnonate aldolase [Rhodobacteraceae bacterium CCMM004]